MDINDVRKFIRTASPQDLNHIVVAIQGRRKELEGQAFQRFQVGDKVMFDARRRGVIRGEVTGFTRTKVLVKSTSGTPWRVSATLLNPSQH